MSLGPERRASLLQETEGAESHRSHGGTPLVVRSGKGEATREKASGYFLLPSCMQMRRYELLLLFQLFFIIIFFIQQIIYILK